MTNTQRRYYELDFLKAIPLIVMPLVHLFECLEETGRIEEGALSGNSWVVYFCIIGPTFFMIMMGAGLTFTRKSKAADWARNGLKFLMLGVVLNLIRFGIPTLIVTLAGRATPDSDFAYLGYMILCSDIFEFVGLAMLVMALMKKLELKSQTMVLISVALVVINSLIKLLFYNEAAGGISVGNKYIDGFLGRFVWMNPDSYFSLFPWLIFVTAGYVFGNMYQSFGSDDSARKKFVNRIGISGTAIACGLIVTLLTYDVDVIAVACSAENDYIEDFIGIILSFAVFGAFLWGAFYVQKFLMKCWVGRYMSWLSSGISIYYMLQWIFVAWFEYIYDAFAPDGAQLNGWQYWLLYLGIFLLCNLALLLVKRIHKTWRSRKMNA